MPKIQPNEQKEVVALQARRDRGVTHRELWEYLIEHIKSGKIPGPPPSIRTVSDWVNEARRQPDRIEELIVEWPRDFARNGIFTDAEAPLFFELRDIMRTTHFAGPRARARLLRLKDVPFPGRWPLYPLVKWFISITRARPGLDSRRRLFLATILAMEETFASKNHFDQVLQKVDQYLFFQPWRSRRDLHEYLAFVPKRERFEPKFTSWQVLRSDLEELRVLMSRRSVLADEMELGATEWYRNAMLADLANYRRRDEGEPQG